MELLYNLFAKKTNKELEFRNQDLGIKNQSLDPMKYISTISHFCDIVVVEKMPKQNATLKIVSTQCGLLAAFLLLAKAPLASKAAYSSKPRASVLSRTQFGKSSNIAKLDAYTSRKWEVTTEHTESFLSGSLSFLCQFFLLLKCTLRTVNDVPKVLTIAHCLT